MKGVLTLLLLFLLSRHSETTFQFNSGIDKQFLNHVIGAPKYVIGGVKIVGADPYEGSAAEGGGSSWGQLDAVPLQADNTADDGGPHYKDHIPFHSPHYNDHFSGILYLFGSKTKSTAAPKYDDSDDSSDIDDSWIL